MIKDFSSVICSHCKSGDSIKIKSDDEDMTIFKCRKCGSVTDKGARREDEKHRSFHEAGVEPSHGGFTNNALK